MKLKQILLFILIICLFSCKKTKSQISETPQITDQELLATIESDCEQLKLYLKDAAIDISIEIDNGLNLEKIIENIKQKYLKNVKQFLESGNSIVDDKGIYREGFLYAISDELKKLPVKNNHMSFSSGNINLTKEDTYTIFYSNVFFTLENGVFCLSESEEKTLEPGMIYTGNTENLVRTQKNGKDIYRFIVQSIKKINRTQISVDNKLIEIPVYVTDISPVDIKNISYQKKDNTLQINIRTCMVHSDSEQDEFDQTVGEICKEIYNSQKIVFDLRNNSGGIPSNYYPIIETLVLGEDYQNREDEWYDFEDFLLSGNSLKLNTRIVRDAISLQNQTYWAYGAMHEDERYCISTPENEVSFVPKYKGKIYIIQNRVTASAAESLTAYLMYFFNDSVMLIGNNSIGAMDFGNILSYNLRDSKIVLHFTADDMRPSIFLNTNQKWHNDTNGFYPDFWFFTSKELFEFKKNQGLK